jgi:hypothetical protein
MALSRNGTEGRVYGGDPDLIHVEDGGREMLGRFMAAVLDDRMRRDATERGARAPVAAQEQPLCPGCYMVVGFDMLVALAQRNGQSLAELGRSMAAAFTKLAEGGEAMIEEICVVLDDDNDEGSVL